MNWIMIVIVFCGGTAAAIQAGVNGGLGKKIGFIEGAFVSFLVGALVLFLIMLFFGRGNILDAFHVPKWQLIGGLLGAFFVSTMVLAVPKIGVASALITVIAAQLITSSLIDHFGWLGMKQIPLDWQRIVAFLLMIIALILFVKK